MRGLLERLGRGETLVADGAMGTLLIERGLEPGGCPERWNLERPDDLAEIAALYLEAGAEIIQTNTFGASPVRLAAHGLADRTEEINARAVEIVRGVVGDRALVAGSCGPSGTLLQPLGDADPATLGAGFRRQIGALIAAGVDLITIETMTDLQEAVVAVRTARSLDARAPICATLTFDPTPRGFFTIMGNGVAPVCRGLADAGADVVGSNCGNGVTEMIRIAREFVRESPLPVLIQPNAGLPEFEGGRAVYRETPERMAESCLVLLELGVRILGGCCGTTPDHVRAIRGVVDRHRMRPTR